MRVAAASRLFDGVAPQFFPDHDASRRDLTSTTAAAGYVGVLFYASLSDCAADSSGSGSGPVAYASHPYGACEVVTGGSSRTVVLGTPLGLGPGASSSSSSSSSAPAIQSTTQLFSDGACGTPSGGTVVAPWVFSGAQQVVLDQCYASSSTSAAFPAFKIESLTAYQPRPSAPRGVLRMQYASQSDCGAAVGAQLVTVSAWSGLPASVVGCLTWPGFTVGGAFSAIRTYRYLPLFSSNRVAMACFTDAACSPASSTACPLSAQLPAPDAITAQLVRACASSSPSSAAPPPPTTFTTSCLYTPGQAQPGGCPLPPTGPAPVSSLAAPPQFRGYVKGRFYQSSTSCSGTYSEAVLPFGECEKSYQGRPGIGSFSRAYSTDGGGTVSLTFQYFADANCQSALGGPVPQPLSTFGGGAGAVTVGACRPSTTAPTTASVMLESVSPVTGGVPAFAAPRGGVLTTSFQSATGCAANSGASMLTLLNADTCYPFSASISATRQCNSTHLIVTVFGDANCQTSLGVRAARFPSACAFQGGDVGFTDTSDFALYQTMSCYVPPPPTSAPAYAPGGGGGYGGGGGGGGGYGGGGGAASAPPSASGGGSSTASRDSGGGCSGGGGGGTAAIAGGVVGGVVGVAVLGVLVWHATNSMKEERRRALAGLQDDDGAGGRRRSGSYSSSSAPSPRSSFEQQQRRSIMQQRASLSFAAAAGQGQPPPPSGRLSMRQQQQQRLSFRQQQRLSLSEQQLPYNL